MSSYFEPVKLWPETEWDRAHNPYLVKFNDVLRPHVGRKDFPAIAMRSDVRYDLVQEYAFAVPTYEAVLAIADASPGGLVEVGAGTGYWSSLIRKVVPTGLRVMAVEPSEMRNNRYGFKVEYYPLVRSGYEYIEGMPEAERATLLMCWPPYDEPMASRALAAFKGRTLAYVGEGRGGCTGDEKLHETLETAWRAIKEVDIPQWIGIYDSLTIFERRVPA